MSEYWISQARKFCEFCKCWITDNKPSVEFHERGKRHKENVQKKIDELRKRSGEKAKAQEEIDAGLAHIEKAALEALRNDLAKDPSLAAQYGVKLKTPGEKSSDSKRTEKAARSESPEPETTAPAAKIKEWFEAKSPDGYSYYWNTATNESVWEPPEEYMSLAEQEGTAGNDAEQAAGEAEEEQAEEEEEEEEEYMKPPPVKVFRVDPRGTRGAAYGAWETIRQAAPEPDSEPELDPEPEPAPAPPALEDIPLPGDIPFPGEIPLPLDIPLPDSPAAPSAPSAPPEPEPEPEPEPVSFPPMKKDKFKEKTVTSLGLSSGGSVGFKKRKIASSARNARQRDDDD